jgi:hypothetical protein
LRSPKDRLKLWEPTLGSLTLEDAMKMTRKLALAVGTTVAGTAAALTMAVPAANAASPIVLGGTAACPVGTVIATLSVTVNGVGGESHTVNTLDHVFHYSMTFTSVSNTFLSPAKASAQVACYGPVGQIAVQYNDHIVSIAHPILGNGWTQNLSPS